MQSYLKRIPQSYLIVILFFLLTTPSIWSQSKAEKIDSLISKFHEYGQFNGAVLVAEHGEILYKKAFGFANMEWNIPNETDTKFRLASVSKQFTSMLILQQIADERLALHEPISTYLPNYPKPNADSITIHQLLIHSSGIPNYTSFPNYFELMNKAMTPIEIVALFEDLDLEFSPGEKHAYSNSGYALLGVILETVTGKSYEALLHEKILAPLKMNNTGFDHAETVLSNRASGYHEMGTSIQNALFINMSVAYAAGGLYSTVEDMFIWDQALYTEQLLPKEYMELIFEKHIPFYGRHYGYGWEIGQMAKGNTDELVDVVNHSGGINGFNTLITRIPEEQSSIIFLNNTGGAPLYYMSRSIAGILYDKPYSFPKRSLAKVMQKMMQNESFEQIIAYYQEKKEDEEFYHDENDMNYFGYYLLENMQIEEAATIFKLNMDAFPTSSNVYDSYGEALMKLGKTDEAIKYYEKSIELNPDNQNGIDMLKKLK